MKTKLTEETRKLQFTGGSTYIVSLPKRWIDQNQLKKGSVIKLREEESGLLSIIPSELSVQQTQEEAQTPEPQNLFADQLAVIVNENGEQKYKDVGAALNALNASQQYIAKLEAEVAQFKTQVESTKSIDS